MRVFIDPSSYIKHFFKSNEQNLDHFVEIEQLTKGKNKKFSIIFPKIAQNEVFRNIFPLTFNSQNIEKEKLQPSSVNNLSNQDAKKEIYNWAKEYYDELKNLKKISMEKTKKREKIYKKLFGNFKKRALKYSETDELIHKARYRQLKGYPPGKGDHGDDNSKTHIGDYLIWEIILENCIDDDLIIVTQDGDWPDPKEPDKLNSFLKEEWNFRTKNEVKLVKSIPEFLNLYREESKKISKEEIEKEKEPSGTQGFPYSLPVTYGTLSSNVSTSPITFTTVQPGTIVSYGMASLSPSVSVSTIPWKVGSTVTTTSTSSSLSPSTSLNLTSINYYICKKCGHSEYSPFKYCKECGSKVT